MRTIALVAAALAGAQERPAVVDVAPARPRAGQAVAVDVSGPADVCLEPAAGRARCSTAQPAGDGVHRARFDGLYAGRWAVVVGTGAHRAEQRLVVRPRGRRLVVLALGDSLVRSVAAGLEHRLRARDDVVLRRDVHPGAGLSQPCCLDWPRHAEALGERWLPDVVLVFLGGNEGYSFPDVPCCADAWVARYAERQRALMQAVARGGGARVHYSTMPAPAGSARPHRRTLWAAENRALALAAADDDARPFDVNAIVSPGFRYRRAMRWRGERRVIRRPDGIHLNRTGGRIVAAAFLRRLRADGVLARPRRSRG